MALHTWISQPSQQKLTTNDYKRQKENNVNFPMDHSNTTLLEQILPDPRKGNSHLKLMQVVTLITHRIVFPSWIFHSLHESLQMMRIPTPYFLVVFLQLE